MSRMQGIATFDTDAKLSDFLFRALRTKKKADSPENSPRVMFGGLTASVSV